MYRCGDYKSIHSGSYWYVGQEVWTIQDGWVTVTKVSPTGVYPLEAGDHRYTSEGCLNKDSKYPCVFTYDILYGTSSSPAYIVGEFYKIKCKYSEEISVCECCDETGIFKSADREFHLYEITVISIMRED